MALAEVLTEQELPSKLIDMFYPPSILLTNRFKMLLFLTPQYGKTSWHKRVISTQNGEQGRVEPSSSRPYQVIKCIFFPLPLVSMAKEVAPSYRGSVSAQAEQQQKRPLTVP